MNLADAIRKAAHSGGPTFIQAVTEPAQAETILFETTSAPAAHAPANEVEPETEPFVSQEETMNPTESETNHPHPAGNVVRLELFLSPEQFHNLFKAVFTTQHSVLTLREAAGYLRIPANSLEQMAADGQVPAMQVDGRWRFTKTALDEWISTQQLRKETA